MYFNSKFVPNKIPYRKNESETIIGKMRNILYNKQPKNTIIVGNSGVGKTTVMRHIFNSIEKNHGSVCCCYVNCEYNNTIHSVYEKIYEKVYETTLINETKSSKNLFTYSFDCLSDNEKNLLVCLDDPDTHFRRKDLDSLIYQLSRPYEHENEYETIVGLYPIVSNSNFLFNLSQRVNSVFNHSEVNFKDYTREQMFEILKERCRHGFCKKVITDEQIEIVANYCYVFSDLRGGLDIFNHLGSMVNVGNDCKVRDEHIDIVLNQNKIDLMN